MHNRKIYIGIDMLRFAAAVMVVAYNLGYKARSLDGYYLNDRLNSQENLWPWSVYTWFCWIGVQIFFVISGFVIAFSSEDATPARFVRGRVARLAPVMWISATICLVITLYWGTFPIAASLLLFAKSVAFFPFGPWIAGQIWTLPIEIMFYLLIFVLLVVKGFHRIDWICLALAGVSAGYWILVSTGIYIDTAGRLTQLLLLQHGCYFTLGAGFWLLRSKGASALNITIAVISLTPTWLQIKTSLLWEKPGFGFEAWPIVPFVIWAAAMALLAASIFWNEALSRRLSRASGVITLLGRLTYPLYLVHFHVGGAVMILAHEAGTAPRLSILLAFVSSLLVAIAIVRWLEKPISSRLSNLMQSRFEGRPSIT